MRRGHPALRRALRRAAARRRRGGRALRPLLRPAALRARARALAALAARGLPATHLACVRGCRSAAERRLSRARDGGHALALLLAQRGADAAAAAALERGRRAGAPAYEWRLARGVLRYPLRRGAPGGGGGAADACVRAADGALPAWCVRRLAAALAPGAPFWAAHGYDVSGRAPPAPFFSYVHELGERAGADGMDQVIAAVHAAAAELWPAVGRATRAEWWAHCRGHRAGHQPHFDSDAEGAGEGGPRHPIASAVVCLSSGGVGGPTLVTTQTSGDDRVGERGWLVEQTRGRLTVFDGRLLHSVVPGRGSAPAGARRTTFMVAFWDAVDVRPGDGPGAARPAPPRALAVPPRKAGRGRGGGGGEGRGAARRVEPREVRPVWETMDGREARGPLRPYDACWAGC